VFLSYRCRFAGAGLDRLADYVIRVIDYEQGSARGSADGLWAEALHGFVGFRHPEPGRPHGQLGHDVVSLTYAVKDGRIERRPVEDHGRTCASYPQLWFDTGHGGLPLP
jgi:hypothetical protein